MREPKYRRRPDRNYAFVEWKGKRIPLPGAIDSPESKEAYREFLSRLAKEQAATATPAPASPFPTITEVVAAYLGHAKGYYPPPEYYMLRRAAKPLVRMFGDRRAAQFGPLALKEVRSAMVGGSWLTPGEKGKSWSRSFANDQVKRIRRIFKWAVEHEMVSPTVLHGLQAVAPLKAGRTAARETKPVQPVEYQNVEAVLPYLTPVLRAMVETQILCGARSQNIVSMRPREVDRSGSVWLYRPEKHKTAWRGKPLLIPLGPRAQSILRPFMERDPDAYCFSPRESQAARNAERRASRKTKVQPSQVTRSKKRPALMPGEKYTSRSYRRAIIYAIDKANREAAKQGGKPPIPRWFPHQLRHLRATQIREKYGVEAARVSLGHANLAATEIYAEANWELASRIAQESG